jgi:uncharacterized SAM-binding protein YcdF (DUF218 family)
MKKGGLSKKVKYLLGVGVFILFLILLITLTNIYKLCLRPLDIGETITTGYGDAILVLGGGLRPNVKIGYSTGERLELAIRLYRQKKRNIIVSDGSLYRRSPAIKKIKDYMIDRGVTPSHIHLEGQSQTTFENCVNSQKIIKAKGFREIVVCTSPYHQKRTQLILAHLDFENFKMARMEESEVYQADGIGQRWRNIKLVCREYFAILKFKLFKN